jgi:hypothetical protein
LLIDGLTTRPETIVHDDVRIPSRIRPLPLAAVALLALATSTAFAQGSTSPGTAGGAGTRAGSTATPSDLPPGATSARGNKAAVPASGASAAVDPNTGSTPGMPPGATSARGDKAQTPKGKGAPSAGASAPR